MKLTQRTQKILFIAPVALLVLGLLVVAMTWVLDKREGYAFQQIAMNERENIVIARMGAPVKTKECGAELWWGSEYRGKNDGRCVQEAHYQHYFDSWAVGYSKDRHVVSKYHYSSK
jgi:hypothetical protein